ncbi:MAG TPA: cyclodeaminase/cyclohydrolase family protein [Clostridiaceae bacterium]|nr:cyclodeaminase/cyclohydrolase family protein [Clostridiaceae bacterium]
MTKLMEMKTAELLALTGSSAPAPGGGSMSSLAGSMAAQLGRMVYQLTEGKKAWQELTNKEQATLSLDFAALTENATELEQLVDEDTNAFNSFMAALALPKTTEEEKQARKEALNDASELSMRIPMQVAVKGLSVLRHLEALARYGNKNCLSDIGVAAHLAQTCIEGALLNVRINLPGIADEAVRSRAIRTLEKILSDKAVLMTEIIDAVNERMEC